MRDGREGDEEGAGPYNGAVRPLALSLLVVVAGPALGQGEGFGGASAAGEEPVCLVQGPEGRWQPCDDLLVPSEAPEPDAPVIEAPPRGEARIDAPLHEASGRAKEIDRTYGAFGRTLKKAREETRERFPLVDLRARVEELEEEVKVLQDHPVRYRDAPAKKAEHAFFTEVLKHVESLGFQRVRACIANEKPEWAESFTPPSMYRMTPGGPVYVPEEDRREMPLADAPGCERVRLVDDELIANVTALHEVEQRLAKGGLGFHERDEKKALQLEVERLKEELGEGKAAPLPSAFKTRKRR